MAGTRTTARILAVFLALGLMLPRVGTAASGDEPSGDARELRIDRDGSYVIAITDKAGFLAFLGHRHAILATDWSARIVYTPGRLEGASVDVTVPVRGLRIDSGRAREIAGLAAGPDGDTVKKLQDKMLGPRALDAERYPTMIFRSRSIDPAGDGSLVVRGQLVLHGHAASLDVAVRTQRLDRGALRLSGDFTIRQSDYGIEPESIAGVVKVADALTIRFDLVAVRPAGPDR